MAHDYEYGWKQKSLKEISANFLKGTESQKSTLYAFDNILKQCEAALSPPNSSAGAYQAEIANLHDLRERIENTYLAPERKLFLNRTGGKTLCNRRNNDMGISLLNFFWDRGSKPDEKCIYVLYPKNLPIIAKQALSDGMLVGADWEPASGRFIYIYRGHPLDNGVVDDSIIPPGYFVFAGNYSYMSLFGQRSVHSFRRIDNPFKDISFYDGY